MASKILCSLTENSPKVAIEFCGSNFALLHVPSYKQDRILRLLR